MATVQFKPLNPKDYRGTPLKDLREDIAALDCHYCIKRPKCKNPNAKTHTTATPETPYYTCSVYQYGVPKIKQPSKPKKEAKFSPQRIAEYQWAIAYINKMGIKQDVTAKPKN